MSSADTPLPDRPTLIRFLAERPDLPLAEAARLLGWTPRAVLARAREEKALLDHGRVAWAEVAFWLVQVWPRALLLEILGDAAALLPRSLQLTEVTWRLPAYLVDALGIQTVREREAQDVVHGTSVEDYVADALHLAIEPETVALFGDDAAFLEAFDFPAAGTRDDGGA